MVPIAIDLETDLIAPGVLAPAPVCGSEASRAGGRLVTLERIRETWPAIVRTSEMLLGANIAFDFGVLVAHGLVPIEDVFRAYDEARVWDVQIAQALDAIAGGCLYRDPLSGRPLTGPGGKGRGRYSLDTCVRLTLGREDAKENDYYRMRYGILREVPVEHWPAEARQYPVDDAVNTRDVAFAQSGLVPRLVGPLAGKTPLRNLADLPRQVRAAWALHLASLWGIRTDPVAVGALRARADAAMTVAVAQGQAAGFLRADGTEDQAIVKRAVVEAYAPTRKPCRSCDGTGKVLSEVSGKPIACKGPRSCDGTGYDLTDALAVPRTEKGGVRLDRDTLEESGDERLEAHGHITEIEKHRSTYLKFLESGTHWPLNTRPNVLVETGRTSYDGVMQTFPKKGGLRECFVPRDGYVLGSVDYPSVELCSLAQVHYDLIGTSSIGDVINTTKDPGALHTALAARMIGTDAADLAARVRAGEPLAAAYRQAAKAANFGFPGGMGAATFVLAKRKRIEGETRSPDGTVTYAGLRLCILMAGADRCGTTKLVEYKGRAVSPVCAACVKCAEDLRDQWFRQWPEMRRYFAIVSDLADTGEMTQLRSGRVRGGIDFTNTANGFFQGLAADGAKEALYRVSRECYVDQSSPLYGTRPLFFAHDEIVAEFPEPIAWKAAPRMGVIMAETMRGWLPDVYIPDLEAALMRRWDKGAKSVYVDGRLVPDERPAA